MKKIRSFFNNTLILALLFILGLAVALSLNSRLRGEKPAAQATDTTPLSTTPTAIAETETPVSAPTEPGTSTPVDITPTDEPATPQSATPEPTWTTTIIEPEGTPPPIPSPPPTPTPTPLNPKEELIVKLKTLPGQLAVSPNDQEIVFNQLSPDGSENQLWKVNLADKQLTKLSEFGGVPEWSPDGQNIAFLRRYWDDSSLTEPKIEIRVVALDGKNEQLLVEGSLSEILDYYWIASDKIHFVSPNGVEQVDQNGNVSRLVNLNLPAKVKNGSLPPKGDGRPEKFIVLNENPPLQIIHHTGERTIIADPLGRSIGDFSLSPNHQQIAYIVIEGPVEELWVTDLNGKDQRKLYELTEGGRITTPQWSPNNQMLAIGHRPTGTYYDSAYESTLIDVDTGQITDLDISQVSDDFSWSRDGQWLYYTRARLIEPPETYNVTLYRVDVRK